jgi:hypothetical protein
MRVIYPFRSAPASPLGSHNLVSPILFFIPPKPSGHPHSHNLSDGTLFSFGKKGTHQNRLFPYTFLNPCPQNNSLIEWRWAEILDIEGCSGVPDEWFRIDFSTLFSVSRRNCSPSTVAVYYRGYNPPIQNVARPCAVMGLRLPCAYCFIAGPVTLYLQSVIVVAPSAPAVISAYLILKRSLSH